MARRLTVLGALAALVLALASTAWGAAVTVRVEGKTQTLFAPVPVKVEASNAMEALEAASVLGEFYYAITRTSFGPYVSQIGRYPGTGGTGWVFKVNGASPPVGADQVTLADGDSVLWYFATFSDAGGPKTLDLAAATGGCYTVTIRDDAGTRAPAATAVVHVDGRRVKVDAKGRACVGPHRGLVRAYAVGAVRSNASK